MKIGIITFHFVSNQGALLQCFALQKYLENQGHEVEIINYLPPYHTVRYEAKKNVFLYARGNWKKYYYIPTIRRYIITARSFFRCIYLNLKKTDKLIKEEFDHFRKRYLCLTESYKSLEELKKNPPLFDAYISGSDQLWNPELLDQCFDNAYFLDFGNKDTIRITYAVSIGKELKNPFLAELEDLCRNIDEVSLREYSKSIADAIKRKIYICVDPTFLLEESEYNLIEAPIDEEEPYIFVYGFETTEDMSNAIEIAKKKYRCGVINGSPNRVKIANVKKEVYFYGPDRFLTYVKNARCIVTNSYHATVFSIIYKKDFITVSHSVRGKRMNDLLSDLGITSRLYGSNDFSFEKKIDYKNVYQKLKTMTKASEEFLNMALRIDN